MIDAMAKRMERPARDRRAGRGASAGAAGCAAAARLPRCPPHLNPPAAAEWRRIARRCSGTGVLTTLRPRRARRLLPGLGTLGRGRGAAARDAAAGQDALGLRAAVALARHRQQAAGADGPLHGRARADAGGAQPGRWRGSADRAGSARAAADHPAHRHSRDGRPDRHGGYDDGRVRSTSGDDEMHARSTACATLRPRSWRTELRNER